MSRPIYLDYAATTPVDERVFAQMAQYLTLQGNFANPSSIMHPEGRAARAAIERAREQVAQAIRAYPEELIWTSGATEAINLALFGAARFYQHRGKHIVTAATEHAAVLDVCRALTREGFTVTYLDVDHHGLLSLEQLENALRKDTVLVSIMHVNNEIGVIQDIAAIGRITRARGILLHVDAAQSFGKIPIDVRQLQVDLLSLSAHKIYGPKGIGALFIAQSPKIRVQPLLFGGGQERGLRSGTLATHQIVAMGAAAALADELQADEFARLWQYREHLVQGLQAIGDVYFNGHQTLCVPGILNVSFNFIDAEALITALHAIAISSGAACATGSLETSHVLKALGTADVLARSAVRLSFGRMTTRTDIDQAIEHISAAVRRLRKLSPLGRES